MTVIERDEPAIETVEWAMKRIARNDTIGAQAEARAELRKIAAEADAYRVAVEEAEALREAIGDALALRGHPTEDTRAVLLAAYNSPRCTGAVDAR